MPEVIMDPSMTLQMGEQLIPLTAPVLPKLPELDIIAASHSTFPSSVRLDP